MRRLARRFASLRDRALRWAACSGGVAAVEFALVLPIMASLLLGMSEVTLGVNMDRKLTLLSRAVADLTARSQGSGTLLTSQLSTSDMSSIFAAASAIMRPYDATAVQMVVTSINVTQVGTLYVGTVGWSCGKNLTTSVPTATQSNPALLQTRLVGSTYAVPVGFQSSTTKSFILAETLLPYTPLFGYVMTGKINLHENTPWPVRDADYIGGPVPCP